MSCHDALVIVIHSTKWRWDEITRNTGFLFFVVVFRFFSLSFYRKVILFCLFHMSLWEDTGCLRGLTRDTEYSTSRFMANKTQELQISVTILVADCSSAFHLITITQGRGAVNTSHFLADRTTQTGMNSLWRCSFCILILGGWWRLTWKPYVCMVLAHVL